MKASNVLHRDQIRHEELMMLTDYMNAINNTCKIDNTIRMPLNNMS